MMPRYIPLPSKLEVVSGARGFPHHIVGVYTRHGEIVKRAIIATSETEDGAELIVGLIDGSRRLSDLSEQEVAK